MISLLLHKTEGKAWGKVLITMISYKSLWLTALCPTAFDHKQIIRVLSFLLHLFTINTLKLFKDLLDGLEIQISFDDLLDDIDIRSSI